MGDAGDREGNPELLAPLEPRREGLARPARPAQRAAQRGRAVRAPRDRPAELEIDREVEVRLVVGPARPEVLEVAVQVTRRTGAREDDAPHSAQAMVCTH